MALESAARVMNGTFGQIWEDGTEIAEVSAFQLKVTNNFDTLNLCKQMAEDRKLIGVKITGSMTLHKVYTRGADAVTAALAGRRLRRQLRRANADGLGGSQVRQHHHPLPGHRRGVSGQSGGVRHGRC